MRDTSSSPDEARPLSELWVYCGLFFISFAAATVLPLQSEAALAGLIVANAYPVWALVAVASAGNVLGSTINWALGRSIERFRDRKWFPLTPDKIKRAQRWYWRYGKWSLLLSWVPFIGDPLTVIAGALREPFLVFLILVTVAKVGRYLALTAMTLSLI
jgi:membrane protein YqaA with SNARE-associated domain